MAESVRVICRCRPLNQRELKLNSRVCVEMDPAIGQCTLNGSGGESMENGAAAPPKTFTFDGVYYIGATAEQIYNDIVYPLVENVIEGYNGTVFAYGQTGSGKTYTMQGEDALVAGDKENVPVNTTQRGIIPRTFEHIFETIATTEHTKFLVHVSYLEIYNEEIRDLLGGIADKGGSTFTGKLDIKEHPERGVYVAGLSMHVCHNVRDCEQLMQLGFNNRHVGATLMNKDSSRSHSIFTIYVEALAESSGAIRMGKLNLVDLAGSERQAKTGATGERFKEATKINLSLSALGNVISALVDGKSTHIPYRDSKLTRLLQDSLGGNTKTVMVACISPSDNNFDETLSTLRYANRAKNIKNKPRINEDPKDALLREYQEEIERLRALMQQAHAPMAAEAAAVVAAPAVPSQTDIEAEKEKLRAEFQLAISELRDSYQREQKSKEKLQLDLDRLKQDYDRANEQIEESRRGAAEALDEREAKKRIEMLEQQLVVGGEQANNEALKAKRVRRIREAEKKMKRLAEALNVHKDDPLLHVYTSTQDKLDALVVEYNREVQKVRSLESEIRDLQGEFELDRLDYLETIRKQDQQLKLLQQILDKLQPSIAGTESNYVNLEKVKREAVWNEDQSRWILPELIVQWGGRSGSGLPNAGGGIKPELGSANSNHHLSAGDDSESRLRRRLDQSMERDFAANYFKTNTSSSSSSQRPSILDKYDPERHKAQVQAKISNFVRRNRKAEHLASGVVYTDELYSDHEWSSNAGDSKIGGGGRGENSGGSNNEKGKKDIAAGKSISMLAPKKLPSPGQRLEALPKNGPLSAAKV